MKINKFLTIAGLMSSIVFIITFLTVSGLTPGYDHLKQPISDLGENGAPYAEQMNVVGFVIPGMLIAVSGYNLRIKFSGKTLRTISVLLIIAGMGWAGIGLFPNSQDKASAYHVMSTYLSGTSIVVAAILLSRDKQAWPWLRKFSIMTGLLLLTRIVTGPLFLEAEEYRGLIQKLYIAVFWLWIICINILLVAKKRQRHYENN